MAKRYIKRYYIRPQNIFCSNKAEILNALVKEVGENNCSVYSLKALEDHDDVHLLQPKDIIYYYDEGILYDKNHVKVMDYDLNVKHEEERKKFGNVDAISDETFDAEYEDRLTESILNDFSEDALANLDPQVVQELKQKSEKFLNKFLINTDITFRVRYSRGISGTRTEKIIKVFIGNKTGRLRIKTNKEMYFLTDWINATKKWVDNYRIEKVDNNYLVETLEDWVKYIWNKEVNKINAEARTTQRRVDKLNLSYSAVANLSPEDWKVVTEWLAIHTTKIQFKIPKIDDELAKLDTSILSLEQADKEREFITKQFARQEAEFHKEVPNAVLNKHYFYRTTSAESDTTYRLWQLSGSIWFDTPIGEAPEQVIKLMEKAQEAAAKRGHEIRSIEKVKAGSCFNSYYFCLMVINLFNGDLDFFNNKDLFVYESVRADHEFDLSFDDVNAYGEKLHEGKVSEFVCCICGEEVEGYGNNPSPVKEDGKCCDACNRKFVIPARLVSQESE